MGNYKQNNIWRLAIALIFLVIFILIAWNVSQLNTTNFDRTIDYWVYSLRNPITNGILIPATHLGDWYCIVGLIALLIILPKTRWSVGIPATLAGIPGFLLYKSLKTSFARPRPDMELRLITQGGYSFPSGHSMNGIICYGIIIYLVLRTFHNRKVANGFALLLALLIAVIGFSRIFVGVHYVTDVMGGWNMGLAYLLAATVLLDWFYFPWRKNKGDRLWP